MAHFILYDLPPEAREEAARLRWQMAHTRLLLAAYRLDALVAKANFNPNEPRVPRGNPRGGKWTKEGGGSGASPGSGAGSKPHSPASPRPKRLDVRPRGIGDNGGPPLEEPPHIPAEPPPTRKLRNAVIKRVAKWFLKAAVKHAIPEIGLYLDAIEAASWIHDHYPYLQAALDEPKSLDELRKAVSNPAAGYDVHHIVEQTPAEADGFPRSQIDGKDNLVRIPTLKHWEITGWYMIGNDAFGGLSPREYLRGKNWNERARVGEYSLRKFGVLK